MDISIFETGSGGDVVLNQNGVETTEGLFNLVYLAIFGGNVQPENAVEDQSGLQFRKDWWGNQLVFNDRPQIQYTSNTERILTEVVLNSSGRATIASAIRDDLKAIEDIVQVDAVDVRITGTDKCEFRIRILEPDNLQPREFVFIWEAGRLEVITEATIPIVE
jgi:ethanolamine utilization cobalamin adenosyltransferase